MQLPLIGVLFLVLLSLAGCETSDETGEVYQVGQLVWERGVADGEAWPVGIGHALTSDGRSLYVTDGSDPRVFQFDLDGNFVRSMGAAGDGPGEISRIGSVLVADSSSIAIGDTGRGIHFFSSSDGSYLGFEAVSGLPPRFGLTRHGVVIVPPVELSDLAVAQGGDFEPLGLSQDGLANHLSEIRAAARPLRMIPAGAGDGLFIVDGSELDAWYVDLSSPSPSSRTITLPAEALTILARIRERAQKAMPPGFGGISVLRSVQTVDGELWISAPQPGLMGFGADEMGDSKLVRPSGREEFRGARDVIWLPGGKIAVLYEDRLAVFELREV